MSEASCQDEQYDRAMGIGCDIDPPNGLMICNNVQCRNIWPTDLTANLDNDPQAVPDTPDCPSCQSVGHLITKHKITQKHKDNHGTVKDGA